MKIAIVTCCTIDWLRFSLATHCSVSRNVRLPVDHIVVTDDEDLPQATALIKKFMEHYQVPIRHEILREKIFADIHVGPFSQSTLFRLRLPQILASAYDRVLFLDSDVLALRPLDEMLQMDLGDMPMAAVNDTAITSGISKVAANTFQSINFEAGDVYFNSGVLLLDWKKTTSAKFMESALSFVSDKKLRFIDQDAFNFVMRNKWMALPLEYNWTSNVDDCLKSDAVIRHFTDRCKPWSDNVRAKDRIHRTFYSDVFPSLGLAPLPVRNARLYANRAFATYHYLKKRLKIWLKKRPDDRRQLREYVLNYQTPKRR